ncbi:collagen alpha-1(XXV) chain-like protein [Labeo rohita]|uniref:Collagen alpha-1(XXV) chain-like protein n=1 Tax=Labeo rohita TaxID=84645 RepID=A0A498MX25_LABRO|nr:collagen alpha-1(XXV) chain-like protein [Labeo rohita]
MENDIDPSKRRHCLRATVDLMPFVFSVVSFAFCFLLSVQTSEIKDRIANMEIGSGAGVINPFHGVSMDQFNAMIQERVDELLSRTLDPTSNAG